MSESTKMWTHPVKETLKKLKPFLGKKADLLWTRYQTAEREDKADWERKIQLLAVRHHVDSIDEAVMLPPPGPEISSGALGIGEVNYCDELKHSFGVRLPELTRHMGVFGSTGSGKTALVKNILSQLVTRKIPFIVFDWERNYRDLISQHNNLKVFTIGARTAPFFFNYLAVPPGLIYQEYVKSVVDVFKRAYVGGVGSDSVLLRMFDTAYQENRLPTTDDVKRIMEKEMKGNLRGREMLWKQSTMRMFDFLSYGGTGEMLGVQENYPVSTLFNDYIVFELSALASPYDKRFFVEMFTLWYWMHKEHAGIEHENLKHVLVFEEFHNIVQGSEKEDLIQKIFRQIRKYGTGLIILDQTPSLIPNPIFENIYTKITFTLSHWQNVKAVSDAMFLEPQERKFIGLLETGQAICRLSGRFIHPFLLNIPFYGQRPQVSEEELKKHMASFLEYSRPKTVPQVKQSGIRSFHQSESLSPLTKVFLEDIAQKPFLAISKRYKNLGLSAAQGNEIQKDLLQKGYVKPLTIDGMKFLELSELGKKATAKSSLPKAKGLGRGGFEHAYYVDKIKNHLVSAGGFVFIEQDDIDVVGYRLQMDGEHTVAVQVETGKSNIRKNLRTLAAYEAEERFMVATNQAALTQMTKFIKELSLPLKEKISIIPAKKFLKSYSPSS